MHQAAVLRIVGNVLLHWAAAVAVLSVVLHARVPWWRSEMGRHLMIYMAAMAIVLTLSCIRVDISGDTWWFALLRLATFTAVPIAMTQRAWLQIKAQRARGDDPSEPTT